MTKRRLATCVGVALLALGAASTPVGADEVTDWNQTMFRAALIAGSSPLAMSRFAAIVEASVFDAVNGIERRYAPIFVAPAAPAGASVRAAAMQAAYVALSNFTIESDRMPGVARPFNRFTAALDDVKDARVFAGIHCRFDCDAGQAIGVAVARYILDHSFQRVHWRTAAEIAELCSPVRSTLLHSSGRAGSHSLRARRPRHRRLPM